MLTRSRAWFGRILGSRNPHVDFLRGLSVLVVMFMHFGVCGPFGRPVLASSLLATVTRNGYYGVSVFFVVSGFVITSTSLRRSGSLRRLRIGEFYVFRLSRLLVPLLLVVLLNVAGLAAGVAAFQLTAGISLPRLLAYVFSLRFNLLYLHGGALMLAWAPLWSLAIEEVFYLLFPLLARILWRRWALVSVLVAGVLLGPIYRHGVGASALYHYLGCFDGLALGCLTALLVAGRPAPPAGRALGAGLRGLGLLALGVVYFWSDIHVAPTWVLGPSLMSVAAAVFLLGSALAPEPSARFRRVAALAVVAGAVELMGYLSYELYLFHLPVFLLITPLWQRLATAAGRFYPRELAFVLTAPLLVGLCALLSARLDEPARRRLRALLSREKRAGAGSPPPH